MTKKEMIEEMAKLDIEESAGFYSAFINDMRISKNKPLSIDDNVNLYAYYLEHRRKEKEPFEEFNKER